jgi:7-cyano-7-deazaguanine synthase
MPDRSRSGGDVAVLVSGGVDSAVLAVDLLGPFERVHPIYIRFGLRWEGAELACLRKFWSASSADHHGLMPITLLDEPITQVYADHWSNPNRPGVPGAATDDSAVYLPGRNLLLATKAAVWCRLRDINALALGTLKANPFPDGTPEFFRDLEAVLNRAMDGRLRILRPYAGLKKTDVIRRGAELGLPLHLTFSCLDPVNGGHCGSCNKCAEREAAFRAVGSVDRIDDFRAQPAEEAGRRCSE